MTSAEPLLRVEGVEKRYEAVEGGASHGAGAWVLRGVDLDVAPGRVDRRARTRRAPARARC